MRTIDVDARDTGKSCRLRLDSATDRTGLGHTPERLEQLANEWTHAINEERRRKIAAEYLRLREWLRAVQ